MSEQCFPYNSISGDRRYKAEEFRNYYAQLIGNGVIYANSTSLRVRAGDGMQVILGAGGAFIEGVGYINSSDLNFTLATADGALNRIDRLVIRNDYKDRRTYAKIKQGSYSAAPVAPILQRDADAYEIAVADIYVAKGVIEITTSAITDQRLNKAVCGIVTGLIQQADTTDIFNQFEDYFNTFKAQYIADMERWTADEQTDFNNWETIQKAAFEAWVAELKEILDEATAGHLQNEIEALAADTFNRFYGLKNATTEFMPDGSIITRNADGVLTVTKGVTPEGYKTVTERLETADAAAANYTKVTTFIPATESTNKIIREEYTAE